MKFMAFNNHHSWKLTLSEVTSLWTQTNSINLRNSPHEVTDENRTKCHLYSCQWEMLTARSLTYSYKSYVQQNDNRNCWEGCVGALCLWIVSRDAKLVVPPKDLTDIIKGQGRRGVTAAKCNSNASKVSIIVAKVRNKSHPLYNYDNNNNKVNANPLIIICCLSS